MLKKTSNWNHMNTTLWLKVEFGKSFIELINSQSLNSCHKLSHITGVAKTDTMAVKSIHSIGCLNPLLLSQSNHDKKIVFLAKQLKKKLFNIKGN